MDALAMIPPRDRSVKAKLQLFLRLWVARQRYEQLRPFGNTSAERIRFHIEQLGGCWDHVVEFQRALGLEVLPFLPRDKFEYIYVISAFVDREVNHPSNTILDIHGRWNAYQYALGRLSHSLNPYDFCDACSRCRKLVAELINPPEPDAQIISMPGPHVNHLKPSDTQLRMKDEPEGQSDSGLSRYSPGGRFSYFRK
jgi:hypothetical protein